MAVTIDGNEAAACSVGCHVQRGRWRANHDTCWPLPLAISSARPEGGSTRRSTSRMGWRLRSAAGLERRAEAVIGTGVCARMRAFGKGGAPSYPVQTLIVDNAG